jgi:ATP-binding cassette subfamily C (CFTR/MRP) protein 4
VKDGPLQQQVPPRAFLSSMSRAISRVWSSTGLAAAAYLRNKSTLGGQYGDGLPRPASAASVVAGQLVKAERKETGGVEWQVYGQYCVKVGLLLCAPLSLLLLAGQACFLAAEWWLALWAASSPAVQKEARWLQVYGALVALLVVVSLLRAAMFFQGTLSAATAMHNSMVGHVLGAPLSFFHTNPAGRILNRFSNDQVSPQTCAFVGGPVC